MIAYYRHRNSNKPCGTPEECKRQKNEFVLSWVVGFLSLCIPSLAFVCCCVVVKKCHSSSRRNVRTSLQQNIEIPTQKNDDFIRQISVEYDNQELDPFKTGFWSLRYNQYGRWHGPYQLLLSFDHALGKVTGKGSDDVGDFTIDGIFSSENVRLGLTQTYKAGTGDPKENFGHTSIIQLNWNSNEKEFQGEWYIQTQTYNGNGELILRFEEYLIPLPDADLEW